MFSRKTASPVLQPVRVLNMCPILTLRWSELHWAWKGRAMLESLHLWGGIKKWGPYNTFKLRKISSLAFHIVTKNSVVGIATGYGLDARGVGIRVPVVSKIFSGPPNLLSNDPMVTGESFPGGKAAGA
jgi:hypothetical protein